MTPDQEDAAIIHDLVAIFPEVKEQVVGDLDLVYEVAGAFALCLRDLIRTGRAPDRRLTTVRQTPPGAPSPEASWRERGRRG